MSEAALILQLWAQFLTYRRASINFVHGCVRMPKSAHGWLPKSQTPSSRFDALSSDFGRVLWLRSTLTRHRQRPSNSKRDISVVQERRHERSSEMLKPHSGQDATGPDVRQILGGLDDGTAVVILRLHPTVHSSKRCECGSTGGGRSRATPVRRVAEILDMLKVDEEEPLPSPRR